MGESADRRRSWNDISSGFSDAADWTSNAASDAGDWTSNAASDAADWTSNAAEAAFVDAPLEVVDFTEQLGRDFGRYVDRVLLPFLREVAKFWEAIATVPMAAGRRRIWDDISSGLSDAADWTSNTVGGGQVSNFAKQVGNAFEPLGSVNLQDEISKIYAPLMGNPFVRKAIMNNPILRSFFFNRRMDAELLEEDVGGSDLVQRLMGQSA